jgi:pimeloyl-ACP methyl ester carboxylesterase
VSHVLIYATGGGWDQADELSFLVARDSSYLGIGGPAALEAELAQIRAAPDAGTIWLGHPYRFWSSYLWYRPLDDLLALDIPLFVAHGTADASVPVESARALRDAFAGERRSNLTYQEYGDADHDFTDVETHASELPQLEAAGVAWMRQTGVPLD